MAGIGGMSWDTGGAGGGRGEGGEAGGAGDFSEAIAPLLTTGRLVSSLVYESLRRTYGWMTERKISELHFHFTRFASFLGSTWTGVKHLLHQVREDFSRDSAANVLRSYFWRSAHSCASFLSSSSEFLKRRCLDLMTVARRGGSSLLDMLANFDYKDLYPLPQSFLLGSLGLLSIATCPHPQWSDLSTEPVITAVASQGILLTILYNRFPTLDASATGVKLAAYFSMFAFLAWSHGRLLGASKRAKIPFASVLRMMTGLMFITVGAAMITS